MIFALQSTHQNVILNIALIHKRKIGRKNKTFHIDQNSNTIAKLKL